MKRSLAIVGMCWVLCLSPALGDDPKFTYVDLEAKSNQKLAEKLGTDGNFLTVPTGEQTFEKVKFKIGDGMIQLGSNVFKDGPEKIEAIAVDKKLTKLHILHATHFGGGPNTQGTQFYVEDGTPIGEYKIRFEDKSEATIPIVYGEDVRDWYFRPDEKETSRAKVAWKGDNERAKHFDCRLRLYLTTWDNPNPDKKVVSIDYISKKDDTPCAPFCVAMTAEGK